MTFCSCTEASFTLSNVSFDPFVYTVLSLFLIISLFWRIDFFFSFQLYSMSLFTINRTLFNDKNNKFYVHLKKSEFYQQDSGPRDFY